MLLANFFFSPAKRWCWLGRIHVTAELLSKTSKHNASDSLLYRPQRKIQWFSRKDFQDSVFLWDFLGKNIDTRDFFVKTVETSSQTCTVNLKCFKSKTTIGTILQAVGGEIRPLKTADLNVEGDKSSSFNYCCSDKFCQYAYNNKSPRGW